MDHLNKFFSTACMLISKEQYMLQLMSEQNILLDGAKCTIFIKRQTLRQWVKLSIYAHLSVKYRLSCFFWHYKSRYRNRHNCTLKHFSVCMYVCVYWEWWDDLFRYDYKVFACPWFRRRDCNVGKKHCVNTTGPQWVCDTDHWWHKFWGKSRLWEGHTYCVTLSRSNSSP